MTDKLSLEERKGLADLFIENVLYDERGGRVTLKLHPLPALPGTTIPMDGFRKVSKMVGGIGFEPMAPVV